MTHSGSFQTMDGRMMFVFTKFKGYSINEYSTETLENSK